MRPVARRAARLMRFAVPIVIATVVGWPTTMLHAQVSTRAKVSLPLESAGIDAIVQSLIGAFEHVDLIALGEVHEGNVDSAIRLALIRSPDFARRVRNIVIECGSTTQQRTLDEYVRGESVAADRLAQVWMTTRNGDGFCRAPMYAKFLAAVRDVNSRLSRDAQIRVFGGEPGPRENRTTVDVLREQVLSKHAKALVIYGSAHFYLTGPADYLESINGASMAAKLNAEYPGRTLSVIPIATFARPGAVKSDVEPDFNKFDRAIKTPNRPVLLSLQRAPFRDLSASEFLGRTLTTCRGPDGCRSVFKGSVITLGQMADAVIYVGR